MLFIFNFRNDLSLPCFRKFCNNIGGIIGIKLFDLFYWKHGTFRFAPDRPPPSELIDLEMGLAEIGGLLSCGRDGTFCTGYDPRIKLERTQTIMQGASHCDFRYRWEE